MSLNDFTLSLNFLFFLISLLNTHIFIDQLQEAHKEYTEHLLMELNGERTRYQNLLTEHIKLEAQYADLKSEQEAAPVRVMCLQIFTFEKVNTLAISAGQIQLKECNGS